MVIQKSHPFLWLFILFLPLTARGLQDQDHGIAVENVAANSEAEKAGIRAGDTLLNWSRGDAKGQIESPFDLAQIESEQAPRGKVTLQGLRGTEQKNWTIGPDVWGIQARPNFQGKLLGIYQDGQELAAARKFEEAAARWRTAAEEAQKFETRWLGPWFWLHAAEMLANERMYKAGDEANRQAVRKADSADSKVLAQLFQEWADSFRKRSDWENTEKYYRLAAANSEKSGTDDLRVAVNLNNLGSVAYDQGELAKADQCSRQALDIAQKVTPESLNVAVSLTNLGRVAWQRGDLDKAEKYHRQALEIRQKLAPGGLDVAISLNNLGHIAWSRGDLVKSGDYYEQSLTIRQQLAPGSLAVADSLHALAAATGRQGDLVKAQQYESRALEIRQKMVPGSLDVALCLEALGEIAVQQGDLAKAEEHFSRTLEIRKKLSPRSHLIGSSLNNLGAVEMERGDWVKAEAYFGQGLEIGRKLTPGNPNLAELLNNLGVVAIGQGNSIKAEAYFSQALEVTQRLAPRSLNAAESLTRLGDIARDRRDWTKAERYYGQGLAITEKISPEGLETAAMLQGLGELAQQQHNLPKAEQYFRRALAIRENLAPRGKEHAESLASLASVLRDQQQPDDAGHFFEQALDALETQTAHLGGSREIRSEFRATHSGYFKDYIDLLIAQKKIEEAFHVAERWRARSLLETLAAARVDIHHGADPELLERERSLQRLLSGKRDRRILLLTSKSPQEQVAGVEREIEALRAAYEQIEGRIRATSPAYAALTQPQPLTAKEVQKLLDDDTLLVEYSLGEERSYLWALTSTMLTCHELPKRPVIEAAARHLYKLISVLKDTEGRNRRQATLRATAAALSRMILAPVAEQLRGKRLLIVADGALQYIPFALLPDPGKRQEDPLILQHEIVYSPSASVLAELRREAAGRTPAPKEVAVLADPVFDRKDPRVRVKSHSTTKQRTAQITALIAQDVSRSAGDVGLVDLPRLAFSRREADAIMKSAPAGQSLEALDFKASRSTATGPNLAQYRVVHFATHALSDNRHPEFSGLVLSLVDQQGMPLNGFLDLQDIYNLNLSAELVVLSGCETALGKEVQGEGLLGLTRGFMYAGATRVAASLWNIDDVSTKELMERFYRAMEQDGMRPLAALRAAQVAMWKQQRWKDPYYWAAFEIQGEWN